VISQFKRLSISLSILFLATACGGKKSTSVVGDTGYGVDYSGTTTNTSNYPTNLFDLSTANDPVATTTAATYPAITPTENYCLASDNYLFGQAIPLTGSTVSTGCYANQNYITPEALYAVGLSMYGSLDQCLSAALSLEPKTDDPNEAFQKISLAEMVILRCVRQQLRSQWGASNWSQQQNQTYQNSDGLFYGWLKEIGQGLTRGY